MKETTIPFGASDSELMEATYFIPQGYHAVIDDNKVIIKKGNTEKGNTEKEGIKTKFKVGDTICNKLWPTACHTIESIDSESYYLDNGGKVEIAHQDLWELEQPIKRTPADIEAAMQEVEEKSKLFTEAHKEDVVSNDTLDDLEKAAVEAFKHIVDSGKNNFLEIFKAGAEWQKEKMMEDAVDGEIYFSLDYQQYRIYTEPLAYFHHGDKVKLIIIKEE